MRERRGAFEFYHFATCGLWIVGHVVLEGCAILVSYVSQDLVLVFPFVGGKFSLSPLMMREDGYLAGISICMGARRRTSLR